MGLLEQATWQAATPWARRDHAVLLVSCLTSPLTDDGITLSKAL
jgi:hypothetical protein